MAICDHHENDIQDVVEELHLALQQTLLSKCPSQLLLQGQPLPSGLDLLPLQQRQAALGSLVTPPCAHMVLSSNWWAKLRPRLKPSVVLPSSLMSVLLLP